MFFMALGEDWSLEIKHPDSICFRFTNLKFQNPTEFGKIQS